MNTRKSLFAVALILIAIFCAAVAMAEEKAEKPSADELKKMSGKDLYKNSCKGCHAEDSDAGEYTPMSLIAEQWEEFFDDGGFADAHGEVVCPSAPDSKVVDHFDAEMLKKIREFCVDHAADSEQPMTCG